MADLSNALENPPLLPYASPAPIAGEGDIFRDGPTLVARAPITLIPFCLLCGAPADDGLVRLRFTWDPSFRVTRRSTLQIRAAATLRAHLCPGHYRGWRFGRIIGTCGMFFSVLLMVVSLAIGIWSESSDVPRFTSSAIGALMVGFALFIGFVFLFTLKTRTVNCRRIENGYIYLEGADEAFLTRLPPLPPPPV
jgi:hypothetical protein